MDFKEYFNEYNKDCQCPPARDSREYIYLQLTKLGLLLTASRNNSYHEELRGVSVRRC